MDNIFCPYLYAAGLVHDPDLCYGASCLIFGVVFRMCMIVRSDQYEAVSFENFSCPMIVRP